MPLVTLSIRSEKTLDFDLEKDIDWNTIAEQVYKISQKEKYQEHEVVLSFCDEEEIQYLNSTFRQKDYVTDVLSFNALDLDIDLSDLEEEEQAPVLGDIIICLSKAEAQAQQIGHSLKRELTFLFIHGLLHLLGYDHELSEEDEKEMFALQDQVLDTIKI